VAGDEEKGRSLAAEHQQDERISIAPQSGPDSMRRHTRSRACQDSRWETALRSGRARERPPPRFVLSAKLDIRAQVAAYRPGIARLGRA